MINASARTLRQYRIGALLIVELHDLAHGQTWTVYRDLDTIAIRADLSELDRRRALAEALTELVAAGGQS